jgi:hypothetical protein
MHRVHHSPAALFALSVLLIGLIPRIAMPSGPFPCEAALVSDVESFASQDASRLAFLQIIDKETYERLKNGGGLGASIPVDGIPLKATANWEKFREARNREFQKTEYSYAEDKARSYLRTQLSPVGAEAFIKCVEANAVANTGVHLWIKDLSSVAATVVVHWTAPPGTTEIAKLDGTPQVQGSSTKPSVIPTQWPSGYRRSFIFQRDQSVDFRLVVNLGGYTDSVEVPEPPALPKSTQLNPLRVD